MFQGDSGEHCATAGESHQPGEETGEVRQDEGWLSQLAGLVQGKYSRSLFIQPCLVQGKYSLSLFIQPCLV